MREPTLPPPPGEAVQAVGRAIQGLAAARLGRAFMPLTTLFVLGVWKMLSGGGGLVLAVGAPLSAGAMLAFALRVVERAFGRPPRPWMSLAVPAGAVPFTFGLWVLGWLGLRGLAAGAGMLSVLEALLFSVLGAWMLHAWLKVLELDALAETMTLGLTDDGGERP